MNEVMQNVYIGGVLILRQIDFIKFENDMPITWSGEHDNVKFYELITD